MQAERLSVTIETDGSGDGTGYINVPHGRVASIHYAKTDYADGVDFTITVESTGEVLWSDTNVNASESVYPRVAVQDENGDDLGAGIADPIVVAADRIKIVVAQGGDTKLGTFSAVIA